MKNTTDYSKMIDLLKSLTGAKSIHQVFNDCIEMYALSIQNVFTTDEAFAENERKYMEYAEKYTIDELVTIRMIFSEIISQLEINPFQNLLGELYMNLGFGSKALKQTFTPFSVAYLMAKLAFDKEQVDKEISENGYFTLLEPSAGSAVNVIAFCKVFQEHGYNFQTQCVAVCQELHRLSALMSYVTLSLIGCPAIIKVGDTLSNPYTHYLEECAKGSEIWTTAMFYVQNFHDKFTRNKMIKEDKL